MRLQLLLAASFVVAVVTVPSAHAQKRFTLDSKESVTIEGQLRKAKGRTLSIQSTEGKAYVVKLDARKTSVSVTGSAEASFLRPGLYVRFSGRISAVDRKPNDFVAKGRVESLTIISKTVAAKHSLGDSSQRHTGKPSKSTGSSATIYGRLMKINRRGEILVATKRGRMDVEIRGMLASKATIQVETTDYSLARKGDSVTVRGRYLDQKSLLAEHLTIELSRPLGSK